MLDASLGRVLRVVVAVLLLALVVSRVDLRVATEVLRGADAGILLLSLMVFTDSTLTSKILATAWEPYQELFQGVIVCIHSDFRIGGLRSGETKVARGKIYVVAADVDALLTRYRRDFPEHLKRAAASPPQEKLHG